MRSLLYREFLWKYRKQKFFRFTDRCKESLLTLVQFAFSTAVVAYFGAHFIVYLVAEHYQVAPMVLNSFH